MIIDLFEHGRIDRSLDMIDDALDLIRLDEDSLESIGCHSTCREVEHVTTSEEILCTDLIEDCTGVDIGCYCEGYTRRDIRLDETCDDIDRWTLGREDEMESNRSSLLCDASDGSFDFFLVPTHHEIRELIDDDHDDRHTILESDFRIVFFEIADTEWLHGTISAFHLSDSPLECIERLIWRIDDGGEEVRDAIIDSEFDLFGIYHDHAEFGWSILVEERENESIHSHRFPRSCLSCDEKVWHLREISDDEVPIDVLPYGECKLRLVMSEAIIFKDFSYTDDIAFLIRDFDPNEPESRDGGLDTDGLCLECECEIFLEGFDLREPHSLTWSESILDHGRSDTLFFHLDVDTELQKCLLDQE